MGHPSERPDKSPRILPLDAGEFATQQQEFSQDLFYELDQMPVSTRRNNGRGRGGGGRGQGGRGGRGREVAGANAGRITEMQNDLQEAEDNLAISEQQNQNLQAQLAAVQQQLAQAQAARAQDQQQQQHQQVAGNVAAVPPAAPGHAAHAPGHAAHANGHAAHALPHAHLRPRNIARNRRGRRSFGEVSVDPDLELWVKQNVWPNVKFVIDQNHELSIMNKVWLK